MPPSVASSEPVIAYLFTTFPKPTETFLQREIVGVKANGANVRIYSLWGGKSNFRGSRVHLFPKWKLLTLLWMIPYTAWRRPDVFKELLKGLLTRRPPSWINFWENMLGAGFACLYAGHFRKHRPAMIHAAWSGGPATAAYILMRLDGHRYSTAAHAYDIYEHGGDWWLEEKLKPALFIHTSTEMGRASLVARGVDSSKIVVVRRGLERLPALKPLRASRVPLRIVCVARLVEKKGLDLQLKVYAALRAAGVEFEARIVGDGPLRAKLEKLAGHLGVSSQVSFLGHVHHHEMASQFQWADVLVHTGVIAPSGDRDGLPNVIPEAMSFGCVVVTTPTAGTTEAVTDGVSGLVLPIEPASGWVAPLKRLSSDDALCETLRSGGRTWVAENFDAMRNAGRLVEQYRFFTQA